MKILLIFFTLHLILDQSFSLSATGYSGGSLMLDSGKLWVSKSAKYLAKLPNWRTIISLKKHKRWINEGRFTLFRNNNGNLMIFIRDLQTRDAGRYLIKVSGIWTEHLNLIVLKAKVGVSTVIGYAGAALMIKCEHPQHKTKTKYICKESSAGCSGEWRKDGDVSVDEDTRAGVLMVFFRELKAADAGTYRCGVKDSEYTERFTQLQLNVRHDAKYPKVMTESVHLGGEVKISCQMPKKLKVYFCKEEYNKCSQIRRASKEPQMTPGERVYNVSVRDAGVYWCGAETRDTHLTFISLTTKIQLSVISDDFSMKSEISIIILTGVCVIALLAVGFPLTVCIIGHKRTGKTCTAEKKTKEKTTSADSGCNPGSAEMISRNEGSSAGLLYASVTFQKHQESLSEAGVAFRTRQVYSDYTTAVLPQ